jgi:Holliday junction resolvase
MGSKRMSKEITLNREQIEKLHAIANYFKEIHYFNIKTNSSSGIGVGVVVTFDLFEKKDTMIDITDVKDW